jgi:hypothetical protein
LKHLFEQRLLPLPEQILYTTLVEGEWTLMESLAHIIEFMPYWGDEIAKLVARPGQNFGRIKEDTGRIRAIEVHKHDSLETAYNALTRSYIYLDEVLGTLKDSDLTLKGRHSKFGEQTLAWFIKDFVTDHLTNHIEQLNKCLQAV